MRSPEEVVESTCKLLATGSGWHPTQVELVREGMIEALEWVVHVINAAKMTWKSTAYYSIEDRLRELREQDK